MAWDVEYTDEFEHWWTGLGGDEQEEIDRKIHLLEELGPTLPRPHADVIVQSRHSNMKELRGKVDQRQLRVLFAFDQRRAAILLIGAIKRAIPVGTTGASLLPMICSTSICMNWRNPVAKNFSTLRAKMSPEARARAQAKASIDMTEMALDEVREARAMTQEHLAKLLGIKQAAVSKMERRADMYVSTLQAMIKAMGGTLQILAVFPEGKVEIDQFRNLSRSHD
jgi:DNA-binding transcriptional regulator YiaG